MPRLPSEQAPISPPSHTLRLCGLFGLVGFGAILLQTNILFHLPFVPDLTLVACVYLGITHGSGGAAAGAFILGYALDSCSGGPVGAHTLTLSLVFLMATLVSDTLWMNNAGAVLGLVTAAVLLKMLTSLLLLDVVWVWAGMLPFLATSLAWDVLSAVLLTPPLFALLSGAERLATRT